VNFSIVVKNLVKHALWHAIISVAGAVFINFLILNKTDEKSYEEQVNELDSEL
jgi:hypothetical protein